MHDDVAAGAQLAEDARPPQTAWLCGQFACELAVSQCHSRGRWSGPSMHAFCGCRERARSVVSVWPFSSVVLM